MEEGERRTLAPYAQKSSESRGRKYPETSHAYRTEYQRDRARIIHSRALFAVLNIRRRFSLTARATIFARV